MSDPVVDLNSPDIGALIKQMVHNDREQFVAILSGTHRDLWPQLADAYVTALGFTDATNRQASIPGVLFVWGQLVKEAASRGQSH